MGTYSSYQTDKNLERTGIELNLGSSGTFVLARAGGANRAYTTRLEKLTKPHRRAIQTGSIDSDLADTLVAQAYAECVLLNWWGVTGPDGQPLEFSPQNAIQLFKDLPDLFTMIQQTAGDASLFRAEIREEDSKNS
jgi:hypothetical protein